MNVTPDGSFPRPAEPLPEHLGRAVGARAVLRRRCRLRAGHGRRSPGGRRRARRADRRGVDPRPGRQLTCWRRSPGPVVVNLSTTNTIDALAARYGCTVTRTKVGEANVTAGMKRVGAVIGGEGNGGVIYPRINFGRDSLVGIALILHLLASADRRVSELVAGLPRFTMLKDRLACPSNRIREVLARLRRAYEWRPDRRPRRGEGDAARRLVPGARFQHRADPARGRRGAVERGRRAPADDGAIAGEGLDRRAVAEVPPRLHQPRMLAGCCGLLERGRPALAAAGGRLPGYPNCPSMYCAVRGSTGLMKRSSVGRASTRRPSSMKRQSSLTRRACAMLWVTMTIV